MFSNLFPFPSCMSNCAERPRQEYIESGLHSGEDLKCKRCVLPLPRCFHPSKSLSLRSLLLAFWQSCMVGMICLPS